VHWRTKEQVLRISSPLGSCTGRGRIRFLGSAFARLLKIFTTARLPPNSIASWANRLHRVQQWRFVVVNPSAKAQYVFCDPIYCLSMYPELLAMLFMLSSMLDLCMLVPVFIMIYFTRNLILHLAYILNNPKILL
jgi:hypothetical protein